jgi:hypothetical protein
MDHLWSNKIAFHLTHTEQVNISFYKYLFFERSFYKYLEINNIYIEEH